MKIITLLLFISLTFFNFSQDTTMLIKHPLPKRAAILSAILPGCGQVYNSIYNKQKKYSVFWKVPIIYTSLYLAGTSLINKINLEKEIRKEYTNRVSSGEISQKWIAYDNYNLILLQKSASRSRNTLYFLTGGIYIIQIIEASIDAHFSQFDLSPDLSLNISPFYSNFNFSGLTFAFNIK